MNGRLPFGERPVASRPSDHPAADRGQGGNLRKEMERALKGMGYDMREGHRRSWKTHRVQKNKEPK